MSTAPVLFWFRHDLRLSDNRALSAACESGQPVLPVYVLDDDGIWVVQNFAVAPSPYVSNGNPAGPGDTFVERDQYIKTNTTLIVVYLDL